MMNFIRKEASPLSSGDYRGGNLENARCIGGSNGDGWFWVFVIVPVIGLGDGGLNTFWAAPPGSGEI